jgi:DNA-binding CsgD family transcriptional regulator
MEYGPGLSVRHVIDSDSRRAGLWGDYIDSGLRQPTGELSAILLRAPVQQMNATRFSGPNDLLFAFCRRMDMVDMSTVTVSHDNNIVGMAGFCGVVDLDARHEMALQLVIYSIFAQLRHDNKIGIVTAPDPLTPREKEVIALSAEGLTSTEISERLGMAARTVNQHVDNVATKLGTKNRAHTVAEAIRHRML